MSRLSLLLKLLTGFLVTVISLALCSTSFAQDDDGDDGDGATLGDLTHLHDFQLMDGMHSRLRPHGDGLMGDSIDPKTGAISFNQTDVALPGNSQLDVSLRRRIAQGAHPDTPFQQGFADWDVDIPIAYGMYGVPNHNPRPPEANGGCITEKGDMEKTVFFQGVSVDFADFGAGVILHVPGKNMSGFPNRSNKLADPKNNWVSAPQSIDYAGRCASVTIAPNGTKYKFGRHAIRTAPVALIPFQNAMGGENGGQVIIGMKRAYFVYLITEVEDVNGNWVRYEYTNNGRSELTRIYSNDGRDIRLNYRSAVLNPFYDNSRRVDNVTVNGRQWSYSYDGTALGSTQQLAKLKKVTLPDDRYWEYGITTGPMNGMTLTPGMGHRCLPSVATLDLKHPDGAIGTFRLRETRHLKSSAGRWHNEFRVAPMDIPHATQAVSGCNNIRRPDALPYYQAISVTSKSISGPNIPTATWSFDYHDYTGGQIDTTWSRVTRPDGTQTINTYRALGNQTSLLYTTSTLGTGHGLLERVDTVPVSGEGETVTYEYDLLSNNFSGLFSCLATLSESSPLGVCEAFNYRPITKVVRTRDSDVYTTETVYNKDNEGFTDYGYPNITRTYSSVAGSTVPRVKEVTYEHNTTSWILGLTKTVSTNGREEADIEYNDLGQIMSFERYGQSDFLTYTYNFDGTLATATDALGRKTEALDWHRGTPQHIKRAVGTVDEISQRQAVDDNGWITSQRDGLGRLTSYSHDNMGRLTHIDLPGAWTSTSIDYDFPSVGGAVQTITKGTAKTTVTYDAMYRAILEHQHETNTGWQSYTNTEYDGMGRAIFTSFPSSSALETEGTSTVYDGLGRPIESYINGELVSSTSFHASHRRDEKDADGDVTSYFENGFGELIRIVQPEGTITNIFRNEFGQETEIRQHGGADAPGPVVGKSQYLYYDDQQRLCEHYVPEAGSSRYAYDLAGQAIAMSKGHSQAERCEAPSGESFMTTEYDALGRATRVRYPNHSATLGFLYEYDNVGNQTLAQRLTDDGIPKVEHAYAYNSLNLPTSGRTRIYADGTDGTPQRDFLTTRNYSLAGYPHRVTYPGGRHSFRHPDGFGRATVIRATLDGRNTTLADNESFYPTGDLAGFTYLAGHNGYFLKTLDNRRRSASISHFNTDGAIVDLSYGYDADSRITSETNAVHAGRSRTFTYDKQGRLTKAYSSNPLHGRIDYSYDALNNLRSKTYTGGQWDGRNISLTYDGFNRLSWSRDRNASGSFDYTKQRWVRRDPRGNIGRIGQLYLDHDMTDQPTRIWGRSTGGNGSDNSPTDTTHLYDAHKRRVKSVESDGTIRYNIFDAAGVLRQVYDATNDVRTDYIQGFEGSLARIKREQGVDTLTFLHADHLGSARAGSDRTGTKLWEEFHTPFGESLIAPAANDNQADYTGHIRDSSSGLNYMQARYYDPVIGRFLSVDPQTVLTQNQDPRFFNRYVYTFNDPINLTDPNGECPWCITGLVGGAVGGVVGGITAAVTGGDIAAGIAGGAVTGAIIGGTGNVALGRAAGGAVGSFVDQANDNGSFDPKNVSYGKVALSAGASVALGKAGDKIKISGLNKGRNSFSAVAKSNLTKAHNGTIKNLSAKSVGKSAVANGFGVAKTSAATRGFSVGRDHAVEHGPRVVEKIKEELDTGS